MKEVVVVVEVVISYTNSLPSWSQFEYDQRWHLILLQKPKYICYEMNWKYLLNEQRLYKPEILHFLNLRHKFEMKNDKI